MASMKTYVAQLGVALMVLASILASPAFAADQSGQLRVGGVTRTYSVHVPDGRPPAGGFPVVLVFHGGGMQGAGMRRLTHFDTIADQRGLIVVYPDGIDKHWNDGRSTIRNPQNDVGFVSILLDEIGRKYPANDRRIFATGLSNGAVFAERLGCDLSQRISAIAPVAGTMPSDLAPHCRPARPVSVLQIAGTADPIMPYRGGAVADFGGKGEGGEVLSVVETIRLWSRSNGCKRSGPPEMLAQTAPFDRTKVARTRHEDCRAHGSVTLLTVIGGGHAWPGGPQYALPRMIGLASRQFDASQIIANFFLSCSPRF
ncbi:esterase [Sphingomonas sp. AP4-R1]|uniref:alpha/beta hydrolase family esterase n=1 Tax=Sphingomonas sp. AP4-R1 TaxID=2735134 RepID=UPI001493C8FD|nr:esterase [Sphingomonas sp. AP4-R1]QJU58239.1 esterase [Sphingomonas sp. AP4-R1]